MQGKAVIGNHPLHPMIVPIPIGAFFLVLAGDIGHLTSGDPFWYRFSSVAIKLGLALALVAAAVGAVDYLSLRLSRRARVIATAHALCNVAMVSLYGLSALLRQGSAALRSARWWAAMGSSTAGFLFLAVAGWLGGKLAFEQHVGVGEKPPRSAVDPIESR